MPIHTSPLQGGKSATLKSPARFAQITPAPTLTPSAVVFRNYRADPNYQAPTTVVAKAFEHQYNGGASNNSSHFQKRVI